MLQNLQTSFTTNAAGPAGQNRILSLVSDTIPRCELKELFVNQNGSPVTNYQIDAAQRQAKQFGLGGAPDKEITRTRISSEQLLVSL